MSNCTKLGSEVVRVDDFFHFSKMFALAVESVYGIPMTYRKTSDIESSVVFTDDNIDDVR